MRAAVGRCSSQGSGEADIFMNLGLKGHEYRLGFDLLQIYGCSLNFSAMNRTTQILSRRARNDFIAGTFKMGRSFLIVPTVMLFNRPTCSEERECRRRLDFPCSQATICSTSSERSIPPPLRYGRVCSLMRRYFAAQRYSC